MSKDETKWRDVTPLIDQLSKELPIGGMVQHPDFSLHRSMSAIELMDPKMDTGMCRDVLPTIMERIANNSLPLRMNIQHASRVMDTLMCQEISHHMGCSLVTSIVGCLYLHDDVLQEFEKLVGGIFDLDSSTSVSDEDLITACVYTYSVALLKCMRIFYNIVKIGDVYEDEDFCDYERYPSPNQEGGRLRLNLADDVDDETLSNMLHFVTSACEERSVKVEEEHNSVSTSSNTWGNLSCRLKLRTTWWKVMASLRPLCEEPTEKDLLSMERIKVIVSKQLKLVEKQCTIIPELSNAVKKSMGVIWCNINPELAKEKDKELQMKEDKKLIKGKSEGNINEVERIKAFLGTYDERESIDKDGAMKYGIDYRTCREFIPGGPPRQKTELNVPTYALRYFQQHVSHLVAVVKCQEQVISLEEFEKHQQNVASSESTSANSTITTSSSSSSASSANKSKTSFVPRGTTTLQSMSDYLSDIVSRNADIFSRSVLNLLILGPLTRSVVSDNVTIRPAMLLGRDPMDECVISNCLEYGILPWMIKSSSGLQSLASIIPATLNGFRLHCLSSARLHRRISKLLSDWGDLQNEIDFYDSRMLIEAGLAKEDNRLYSNRFGSYVLDMSLELMKEQLMLGFSLELYSINEMIHVNWYCGRIMHMQVQNRTAALNGYSQRERNPQPAADNQEDDFADTVMDVTSNNGSNKHKKNKKGKKGKKGKKVLKKGNKKKTGNKSKQFTTIGIERFPRDNSHTAFVKRSEKQMHMRKLRQLDMEKSLSRAYLMSFFMMLRLNAVKCISEYNLGTNELRFENRFLQFFHFNQASPIKFQELKDQIETLKNAPFVDLSEAIKKQFNYAASCGKTILDECPYATKKLKKQIKSLSKLCILNGIAMTKISKYTLDSISKNKNEEEKKEEKCNFQVKLEYKVNKMYSSFELDEK